MYRVLLYYKYVNIGNSEEFAENLLIYCQNLGLRGRIIVAPEGINGTCSGTYEQTEKYMSDMKNDERFSDMEFKIDEVSGHVFKKMNVRFKKELVTFRLPEDINPNILSGKRLSPAEWYQKMQEDDVIILDGRTDYEFDLGHFRKAIRPPVKSFREFPAWVKNEFSKFKNKKILTYCTGGVRCEKLSGFLLKEGFNEVYQLQGGIINYSKDPELKGKLFEGKCYVFDERISIPVNFADEYNVTGKCHHCGKPTDRYVNCANLDCHKQHFECEDCEEKWSRSCSEECMIAPRNELFMNL
ncbi:MAG: rhodanese-related sulfurtransferase [Chlorobi bacterium]|nr:rhodanese-related sulfurtransferase [Chlorobiota bacterium]MCI0715686.1 rhodanese-related sulfurtransferase [Chlorobiota bacterium]